MKTSHQHRPDRILLVAALLATSATICSAAEKPLPPRVLVDFADPAAVQLGPSQATAAIVTREGRHALRITTQAAAAYPSVVLTPRAGKWDLSGYEGVEMDVVNPQEYQVRVLLQINNPGFDGVHHCNVESATIKAHGKGKVSVPFGNWHGGTGHELDLKNIVSFSVLLDKPGKAHTFLVGDVSCRAVRRAGPGGASRRSFLQTTEERTWPWNQSRQRFGGAARRRLGRDAEGGIFPQDQGGRFRQRADSRPLVGACLARGTVHDRAAVLRPRRLGRAAGAEEPARSGAQHAPLRRDFPGPRGPSPPLRGAVAADCRALPGLFALARLRVAQRTQRQARLGPLESAAGRDAARRAAEQSPAAGRRRADGLEQHQRSRSVGTARERPPSDRHSPFLQSIPVHASRRGLGGAGGRELAGHTLDWARRPSGGRW